MRSFLITRVSVKPALPMEIIYDHGISAHIPPTYFDQKSEVDQSFSQLRSVGVYGNLRFDRLKDIRTFINKQIHLC